MPMLISRMRGGTTPYPHTHKPDCPEQERIRAAIKGGSSDLVPRQYWSLMDAPIGEAFDICLRGGVFNPKTTWSITPARYKRKAVELNYQNFGTSVTDTLVCEHKRRQLRVYSPWENGLPWKFEILGHTKKEMKAREGLAALSGKPAPPCKCVEQQEHWEWCFKNLRDLCNSLSTMGGSYSPTYRATQEAMHFWDGLRPKLQKIIYAYVYIKNARSQERHNYSVIGGVYTGNSSTFGSLDSTLDNFRSSIWANILDQSKLDWHPGEQCIKRAEGIETYSVGTLLGAKRSKIIHGWNYKDWIKEFYQDYYWIFEDTPYSYAASEDYVGHRVFPTSVYKTAGGKVIVSYVNVDRKVLSQAQKLNPRNTVGGQKLQELMASMKQHVGYLVPFKLKFTRCHDNTLREFGRSSVRYPSEETMNKQFGAFGRIVDAWNVVRFNNGENK